MAGSKTQYKLVQACAGLAIAVVEYRGGGLALGWPVTLVVALVILHSCMQLATALSPALDSKWEALKLRLLISTAVHTRPVRRALRRSLLCQRVQGPSPEQPTPSREWLAGVLHTSASTITSVSAPSKLSSGFLAQIYKFQLQYSSDTQAAAQHDLPASVVLKSTTPTVAGHIGSVTHGAHREAAFYEAFLLGDDTHHKTARATARRMCPTVYASSHNASTGRYAILVEDLSDTCTLAVLHFGNQFRDMPEAPLRNPVAPEEVLLRIFLTAADLHASCWNDTSLLSLPWLRMTALYKPAGSTGAAASRLAWEKSVASAVVCWSTGKGKILAAGVKMHPGVEAVMDASIGTDCPPEWHEAHEWASHVPFTMVHGDFHSQNMFWRDVARDGASPLALTDWAMAGVGDGTADLGQVLISDVPPALRRANEERVFNAYYDRLVELGVDSETYPRDVAWQRYKRTGLARFVFCIGLMADWGLPLNMMQYLVDQMGAWIDDHLELDKGGSPRIILS